MENTERAIPLHCKNSATELVVGGHRKQPMSSLLRVGYGRGFVVAGYEWPVDRYVITAAHCLLTIPRHQTRSCKSLHDEQHQDMTLPGLVGPLDDEAMLEAECIYIDPTADIAVLSCPSPRAFEEEPDEAEADLALIDAVVPLKLGDSGPLYKSPAYLIALDGRLVGCVVRHDNTANSLWIEAAIGSIADGMSGSPVLSREGKAIGIVASSHQDDDLFPMFRGGGRAIPLVANLPGRLLMEMGAVGMLTAAWRRRLHRPIEKLKAEIKKRARRKNKSTNGERSPT